jgi:4-amino-4-deoxy-L-arabinose transferase-like glycosyltransferase
MRRPRWSTVLAGLIVTVAAVLRLWQLDSVPLGLHNDEAWTGLNAREVLRDGWIGPYLYPSGLGQPAGPAYFTALLFTVLPQTTFTLRLSMALFGIATVALTYAAGRALFDCTTALFAAALLAVMPWHLHLSRTGLMVQSWPCIEMVILWAVFRARARPSVWAFAGVGLLIGLGIYTYNAYPLFVPVAAVPFLYDRAAAPDRAARRRWLVRVVVVSVTAAWAAALMVDYAARHEEYFWHHRDVSVFHTESWRAASWPARARILVARGGEWAQGVFLGGRPDQGDGLGGPNQPLLDPLTGTAAVVGLAMAARGWRRPACGVLLAAAVVLPFGALLTTNDGLYRRTFGLAPFAALLAALPLAWLWQRARTWRGAWRALVAGAIVLGLIAVAARNTHAYFGPLQRTQEMLSVYPYQIDAAARLVARLPRETIVYLYSDRWGARFETVRWLAPTTDMLDRSREFRAGVAADAPVDFSADGRRPTAFLLLGNYLGFVTALQTRYPNAVVSEAQRDGEVLYRLVDVRAEPAP